jgi:YihY family inner membrane protein
VVHDARVPEPVPTRGDELDSGDEPAPTRADESDPGDAAATRIEPIPPWIARLRGWHARWLPDQPVADPSPRHRAWLYVVYVVRRFFREDRGAGMAALLTVQTLLSTVPMIGVALLLVGLMDATSGRALLYDIFRALVPHSERAEDMAHAALELAHNVSVSKLGAWGFLVTLLLAFALFSTLEQTCNRIWRVVRARSLLVKFTMFYTLATLGPALLLLSLAQPLATGATRTVAWTSLSMAAALVLLNRYIPHTPVRWRAALVGGLFSALLIDLAKYGFGYYATRFALATYDTVYGSLAMLPILVVWSYLSWLVILLGAEVAWLVQHRRTVALEGYVNRYVRERSEIGLDSGRTAARLLLAIGDRYARRGTATSTDALAERFGLAMDRVGEILAELARQGLVLATETADEGWVPGRPLARIRLVEVLQVFEREQTRLLRADRLSEVFGRLDGERAGLVGDLTYADLVTPSRSEGA